MICIKLASEEWDFPKKHSHFTRYGGTPSHSNHTMQEHGSSKDGNTVQVACWKQSSRGFAAPVCAESSFVILCAALQKLHCCLQLF